MNPIFSEGDDPVDGLNRVSYILRFLIDLNSSQKDLALSKYGNEGYLLILTMMENATREIAKSVKSIEDGKKQVS